MSGRSAEAAAAINCSASATDAAKGLSMTRAAPEPRAGRPCSRCTCAGEASTTRSKRCASSSLGRPGDLGSGVILRGLRPAGRIARRDGLDRESRVRRDERGVEDAPGEAVADDRRADLRAVCHRARLAAGGVRITAPCSSGYPPHDVHVQTGLVPAGTYAIVARMSTAAEGLRLHKTLGRFDALAFVDHRSGRPRHRRRRAVGGAQAFLWLALMGLSFLIPSALITAELGAALPHEGGHYVWTSSGVRPDCRRVLVSALLGGVADLDRRLARDHRAGGGGSLPPRHRRPGHAHRRVRLRRIDHCPRAPADAHRPLRADRRGRVAHRRARGASRSPSASTRSGTACTGSVR